jgi:acetyl-CoA acetyltransferase
VTHAYICDAIRTPIGRFTGVLFERLERTLDAVLDQVDLRAALA